MSSALLEASIKLVEELDKVAEKSLPEEIAGVVKLHAKIGVGTAWIPVPGADIAASAANIWTMYFRINSKIGVKFGESIIKTIASAVATNLGGYFVCLGVGAALKFIPGIGSIGGAVAESVALYALTLASGYVYLKVLTSMLKKGGVVNEKNLKEGVDSFLKNNKSEIKNFIKEAKEEYKKEKEIEKK